MRDALIRTMVMILAVLAGSAAMAEVRPAGIFGDHMVLQREMAVPIWGTAAAGEAVSVTFAGQTVSTTADAAGRWSLKLAPMKASSEPRQLTLAGTNTLELTNILVGDVWIASGQSNMELNPERGLPNPQPHIDAANQPMIRMIAIGKVVAEQPLTDVKGSWSVCTPEAMRRFSAAAYFFAREVREQVDVPIGLVGAYYGGSNGVSWTRREALLADPELAETVAEYEQRMNRTQPPAASQPSAQPAPIATAGMAPSSGSGRSSRYRPSNFYNGMIAPLMPFAIKGVIWYQGEADTASAPQAARYGKLFPMMIQDWREQWGQGDFPFIFVQLPTSEPQYQEVTDSAWARVRESQTKALALKNTAMVVTIDIGEGDVVHARNKDKVGRRLGQVALNKVYGKTKIPADPPMFRSMEIKGNEAILTFTNADGLVSRAGATAPGFAIAGENGNFIWADARVEGGRVIVSSAAIDKPAAVRYAWADNPQVSLFNAAGLPVIPFRTDDWPATKISDPRASP